MATKTELEFNYEPSNYFEEAQHHRLSDGELRADDGKAVVVLDVPSDFANCADVPWHPERAREGRERERGAATLREWLPTRADVYR